MAATYNASPQDDPTELRLLVQRIKDLPTVPSVLMKLLSLTADASSSVGQLAEIIGMDQTISAKLLRLSNSAFYGCRGKVVSVPRAIVVLGFNEVKSLALGMSVFHAFSQKKAAKGEISIENLWKHSMATAALARLLAKRRGDSADSTFTGGLLHDIGKVVLLNSFKEEYKKAAEMVSETGCSLPEAEEKIFRVTHETIGEWLCRKWSMPEEIVQCVKYHSNPRKALEEFIPLVSTVHIADGLTKNILIGYGGDEKPHEFEDDILAALDLNARDIEEAEAFMEAEREGMEQMV
ncbi:MAG: HDOD domain-containing protein [Nitrospinae bacterium]|nr:HDOD domain-containing protein [Nitrospinota bacterium]